MTQVTSGEREDRQLRREPAAGVGGYVGDGTDRAGFEPARRFEPSTRFPGAPLKPLEHPSKLDVAQGAQYRGGNIAPRAPALHL